MHKGWISALGWHYSNLCAEFVCGANFDVCYDKLKVVTSSGSSLRQAQRWGPGTVCLTLMSEQQRALLFACPRRDGLGSLPPFPVDNGQQQSVTTVDHSEWLVKQNRASRVARLRGNREKGCSWDNNYLKSGLKSSGNANENILTVKNVWTPGWSLLRGQSHHCICLCCVPGQKKKVLAVLGKFCLFFPHFGWILT